jgi:caa(3)-type oxidase subunit IV
MTDSTDVAEPGTEIVPASDDTGDLVATGDEHAVSPYDAHHPSPRQYVMIGIILVILTGIEVAASYLEDDIPDNLLIAILAVMAFIKFFLVCAWYMHMKQDIPFFRRIFVIGIVGATIVYGIVMLVFASSVLSS